MRAFIAIDIGEKEEIVELLKELKKIKGRIKPVEPENIHLTLKFLGEIDEGMIGNIKEAIEKSIEGISPFKASLSGLGVFTSIDYMRVLWIGFKDEGQTKKIAAELEKELHKYGFKKEKGFTPHVTIARIKSKEVKEEIRKFIERYKEKSFGEVECNEIRLKKSILKPEGPIYKTIEEIKL